MGLVVTYCWEGSSESMNNTNGVCGSSHYFLCYRLKVQGFLSYIGEVSGGLNFVK